LESGSETNRQKPTFKRDESKIQSFHQSSKILGNIRPFFLTLILAILPLSGAIAQPAIGTITRDSIPPPESSTFAIFALGALVLLLIRRSVSRSRMD
jgi:hypothetical protein